MRKKAAPLHPAVRTVLGYGDSKASDSEVLADWSERQRRVCKPCWELKYCPYGPLVEQFPLPPLLLSEAEEHLEYFRECLKTKRLGNGDKLDEKRRKWFEDDLKRHDPSKYPTTVPPLVHEVGCRVFGHICPVFFSAEPLTETRDVRKHSRSIPREVMLKVVRRDGQICQRCHKPVPDNEVEFDHIIPFSKGGASTADNIRLLHRDCNRDKSDALEELLAPDPMIHYVNWKNKAPRKK